MANMSEKALKYVCNAATNIGTREFRGIKIVHCNLPTTDMQTFRHLETFGLYLLNVQPAGDRMIYVSFTLEKLA